MKLTIPVISILFLIISCKDSPKKNAEKNTNSQEKLEEATALTEVNTSNMVSFKGGTILLYKFTGYINRKRNFK